MVQNGCGEPTVEPARVPSVFGLRGEPTRNFTGGRVQNGAKRAQDSIQIRLVSAQAGFTSFLVRSSPMEPTLNSCLWNSRLLMPARSNWSLRSRITRSPNL